MASVGVGFEHAIRCLRALIDSRVEAAKIHGRAAVARAGVRAPRGMEKLRKSIVQGRRGGGL